MYNYICNQERNMNQLIKIIYAKYDVGEDI